MSRRGGYQAWTAALGALAAVGAVAAALTIGIAGAGGAAASGGAPYLLDASVRGPDAAVTYQVSDAAQDQTVAHWTARRMRGATPAAPPRIVARPALAALPSLPGVTTGPALPARDQGAVAVSGASASVSAPKGTPTATPFAGSPTTGALFYTSGGKGHFCTASVVDSAADDLALTAAHCVYSKGFATDIEYVPGYHDGKRPYGAWPVRAITVASGWKSSHDPDLDFAFLLLATVGGRPVQDRTGALTLGFTRWYSEKIEVIGHNDTDAEPIRCATKSFRLRTGQMEFYCHGFWNGTSGGPWIIGYDARNGTGTVFGVIGGYELGGDYEWASYSAYFGSSARVLYEQVEGQGAPHPAPSPSATATASPTAFPPPASSPTSTATPTPTTSPPGPISTAYHPPAVGG